MMELERRAYTDGQFFRPTPVILEREESRFLAVATPWGPVESGQKAVSVLTEQFELLGREDMTTPFESIPTLSPAANRLRIGALTANQYLFRNENAKLWKTAVELAALHFDNQVLSWVQVGSPHIILNNQGVLHPIAYEPDWAFQSGNAGPLFSQALGLESLVPLHSGSLRIRGEAEALLISRGTIPRAIFQLTQFSIDAVTEILVGDDPHMPFWAGVVKFGSGGNE